MAEEGEVPLSEHRGPGRPRKDGLPPGSKPSVSKAPSQGRETKSRATKEDWALLHFTGQSLTILAGDFIHKKNDKFPTDPVWTEMRCKATKAMLDKYGEILAANATELSFVMVWVMSFASMGIGDKVFNIPMSALFNGAAKPQETPVETTIGNGPGI